MDRLREDLDRALKAIGARKICQICFQPIDQSRWQSCHETCLEKVLSDAPADSEWSGFDINKERD